MFNYHSNFIHNYYKDGIILTKSDNIVYHYTSPEGFLGILTNQNVRFTDIRYMNDRSEGVYFVKLLLEFIEKNKGVYPHAEEVVNNLLGENNFKDIKALKTTNIKYRTIGGRTKPARAFLFCTCSNADSLNMWNYYVKNGSYQGYNIGFRVDAFLETIAKMFPENEFTIALTGSGAIDISKYLEIPFIQEVIACKNSVEKFIPQNSIIKIRRLLHHMGCISITIY